MQKLSLFRAMLTTSAALVAAPALADTLVYNVDGVTIDEAGEVKHFTELVFDDDGVITHVLERGEERPEDIDFALDGEGQVMLPGMIDAHVHVMDIGFAALTLDLSDTNSLEEALAKVAEFAEANPGRPWILGRGWNQEKWGLGRFPTAAELDAVVSDRPVWLETRRQSRQLGQQRRNGARRGNSRHQKPRGRSDYPRFQRQSDRHIHR